LKKNIILIPVCHIDSFSLAILQIQSTMGTLIFTIITLIAGTISDSYMGVTISDFYLNIRPWKLTQKVLIIISIVLSLAGVILYSFGLYNSVFYLFVATLIAILISITEMYSIFKGKNRRNQEIEAYINYIMESNTIFDTKQNIYQNFVSDWKEVVALQDKQSYEKFFAFFKKCMEKLWDYGTDEALISLEQECYNMSYSLLESEKNMLKKKGIDFVQIIYRELCGIIDKCRVKGRYVLNQYKNEFHFFSEISDDLKNCMDEINIEEIERRFRFGELTDSVLRVAVWLRFYEENNNANEKRKKGRFKYIIESEKNELNWFAANIGYYLETQCKWNRTIDQNFWANQFSGWRFFSTYGIPEGREDDFLKAKVDTYFYYCYGMLIHGQEDVVRQGLYLNHKTSELDNKYQALFYIGVHCYIYYLAEREHDDCILDNIRQSARKIWYDGEVKNGFWEFLENLSEHSEWIEKDFPVQIYKLIGKFEFFPQNKSVKTMIMEYAILDFYLFLILLMSRVFLLPDLLERNIDDIKALKYTRYILDENENQTKRMFSALFKMISIDDPTEEQIENEVDLMYNSLEKAIKSKKKDTLS